MGVSRRSRVPERITRPDERFDSSQVGLSVLYYELFAGRSLYKEQVGSPRLSPQASGPAWVGGFSIPDNDGYAAPLASGARAVHPLSSVHRPCAPNLLV